MGNCLTTTHILSGNHHGAIASCKLTVSSNHSLSWVQYLAVILWNILLAMAPRWFPEELASSAGSRFCHVIIKQRPIRFSSKNNQLQRQMMTKESLFHYWFWFCWNKKYISISYLPLQPSERMLTSGWERACHSWDEDDEDNKNKTWDIIKQKGLACATIIFLFSYRTHKTDALKSVKSRVHTRAVHHFSGYRCQKP